MKVATGPEVRSEFPPIAVFGRFCPAQVYDRMSLHPKIAIPGPNPGDLHPADTDPSAGTRDLGYPGLVQN